MSDFVKRVSPLELVLLAFRELRPPGVNQLVIEGVGPLDEDALRSALDVATIVNPGCTLRLLPSTPSWTWIAGPPPRLTVIDAPNWSGRDPEHAPFLERALDPHEGPSCELMLVRARSAQYLVFRSLHAVMDGSGTLSWAKEVLRALRREPLLQHESALTSDQLEAELSSMERSFPAPDALHPFGRAEGRNEDNGYQWRRITIARALRPWMLTELAVALGQRARSIEPGIVRFHIPTDLRSYRPSQRSTGNLSGMLWVEPSPDTTADQLGLDLIRQLYEKRPAMPPELYRQVRLLPFAFIQIGLAANLATEHQSGLYPFTATLSHLGLTTSSELSAPGFTATSCFFVPLFADWACYVVLNGFDQQVEVAVALPTPHTKNEALTELAELVRRALTSR